MVFILFTVVAVFFTLTTVFTVMSPHVLSTLFYMFFSMAEQMESEQDSAGKQQRALISRSLYAPVLAKVYHSFAALLSWMIEMYSKVLHDHQVVGLENIPRGANRPALLIFYHGVLPSDMVFVGNQIYRRYGRMVRTVGDKFLFMIPGPRETMKKYIFAGPAQKCVEVLENGHLLQIAPGGTREALFATKQYETLWNNRCGFARVARQAQVDLIPIFTSNIRQVYILWPVVQKVMRPLYEWLRLPIVPFFGGFPVKLTTYVGKPIAWNAADTAEELAKLTQKSVDQLIATHQRFPAKITDALADRFH